MNYLIRFYIGAFLFSIFVPGVSFASDSHYSPKEKLSLDDVSKIVIASNLDIKIFNKDLDIKLEDVMESQSIYDTTLSGEASYLRDESPNSSVFAATRSDQTNLNASLKKKISTGTELEASWLSKRDETNTGFVSINPAYTSETEINVKQPLLHNAFGYLDRQRLEAVELDVEKFKFETWDNIENAVLNARAWYWEVRRRYRTLFIRKKALKDAWYFHQSTLDKLKLGLLEKPDEYSSMANVKSKEIDVLVAKNEAIDAENELKSILQLPLNIKTYFDFQDVAELDELTLNELTSLGIESRSDRKAIVTELKLRGIELEMAKNALWPRLDLEASIRLNGLDGKHNNAFEEAFDGETPTYFAGLTFSHPLENRSARAKENKAKLTEEQALLKLDRLEIMIQKEIDEAYREVLSLKRQLSNTSLITQLQQSKLKEEMKRFEQGRSSSKVIVDYHNDYLNAQESFIRIQYAFFKAQDHLMKVTGSLLDRFRK